MKEVNKQRPTQPADWEIIIFGCHRCGRLWRIESVEEANEMLEMWAFGALAYMSKCPVCKGNVAVEVPLLPHEKALFRYIYDLEQGVPREAAV